jgi:hypothetical protein
MALTKVTTSGIACSAVTTTQIADTTILAADIAPGTISNAKLSSSSITINGVSTSLGGTVSVKQLNWQSVQTSNFTAVAGYGYFINTTSGAITMTLPTSPAIGDTIGIVDYAETWGTNNLTIARNGSNIQGVANNSLISTSRASLTLVYVDATKGWLYHNQSNVSSLQQALYVAATGGTVLTNGSYKTHVFTGCSTFVVSCAGNSSGSNSVEYLVVAGGGGSSAAWTGGGGAGGYRQIFPSPSTGGLPVSATTYPVTVGAGGATQNTVCTSGNSGSPSTFSTITSAGGGGAGFSSPGINGGSGGGGAIYVPGPASGGTGGVGNTPPVSPPQGNPGGAGQYSSPGSSYSNGGGGGASCAGVSGSGRVSGSGGNGSSILCSVFGPTAPSYGTSGPSPTGRYFAGGGGGGGWNTPVNGGGYGGGGGGIGGGGIGQNGPGGPNPTGGGPGTTGTTNTGGGAGGGGGTVPFGAGGGKGIVVIRYKYQA